tara:strand:+ start:100 stop:417 length:318 start_codon:yes stop_codon:yes gene_type:complete
MRSITTHFQYAFRYAIQKKTDWHLGKPVEKRLNFTIWKYMYIDNPCGFTFEQVNLIIKQDLERSIDQFKDKCIEQVELHYLWKDIQEDLDASGESFDDFLDRGLL